jgi:hypothetical protein
MTIRSIAIDRVEQIGFASRLSSKMTNRRGSVSMYGDKMTSVHPWSELKRN